jgi:hypothetical protein
MTYRPAEAVFGPPLSVRWPSFLYLGIALIVGGLVLIAENSSPETWLNHYFVQRDASRFISSRALAVLLLVSALASVLRAGMRGVKIRGDGVEYRDVVTFLPKLKRYKWAQIDRIVLDSPRTIVLDLWDGTRAFLPLVNNRSGLAAALEKVAFARAIPVRGGTGLDEIPESTDFEREAGE